MTRVHAIIAGGGTAGHVLPGLAIAAELIERGVDPEAIRYVGSARGIETRLVPEAGLTLTTLPGRGIQRRLTWANVGAVLGLLAAVLRGIWLVVRLRPAVVVGLGGYASVPCVFGAILCRVPIVVAEQNAVPGAANRLAGRFARACAVSFPGTDLPNSHWTGNPVRDEIRALSNPDPERRRAARQQLNVNDQQTLLVVFGGSLGARRINHAIADVQARWSNRGDLVIRHVSGTRDFDELSKRSVRTDDPLLTYELVAYEDDMPTVFAAADLILCRSGASSVAELAVAGLPSVLVPLPGAPGDHQTANARALVDAGAAVLVPDAELTGERAFDELDSLINDPARRTAMRQAATSVARPDAAHAVVDLMETYARRPRKQH